jgi:anti-sigma factor RsiW
MNAPIHPVVSRLKKLLGLHMGCYDMHRLLFDYAQETLPPELKAAMDQHLKDCPPCLDYLQTYRATICATRECCQPPAELPPELRQKLSDFIAKL